MTKIALIQMAMSEDMDTNLNTALSRMTEAAENGANIVVFPEIMLSPFFPQYKKQDAQDAQDASAYLLDITHPAVKKLQDASRELGIVSVPNIYLSENGKQFDASVVINHEGKILGISKMVHIVQMHQFYEQDYYSPSDTGFQVFETDFGKIGVVVCFDRHFPESVRSCALQGADLIVIPTVNCFGEALDLFEAEMRVAAYQNGVYVALCNRVGKEGEMDFNGESIIVDPNGTVIAKAGTHTEVLYAEMDFQLKQETQDKRPFLKLRRPGAYLK